MKKTFFLLLLPLLSQAQKDYTALLDNYMNAAVAVNKFSGSVLIAKGEKIIYEKTFGTLDYLNTKPLDSNSLFQLGIITEEFTAAAILLLKQEGKLQLSDRVTKFFPQLPYSNVTIHHLLTHTSGLPDYYDEVMKGKWGTTTFATNTDMVKSLAAAKVPLAWSPGTKYDEYHYFTEYPLLAAIIEKISGLSYAVFMQQKIFAPLHLSRTKVITSEQLRTHSVANHTESVYFNEDKQQFFPADSFYTMGDEYSHVSANILGGRGISSTAHDLFVLSRALQHHLLLPAVLEKERVMPYALRDTVNKISFGYGVLAGNNEFGSYVQQRETGNNETLGYLNALIHYENGDITIINLANKGKTTSAINGTLAYILFDRDIEPPYVHKAVSVDTSLLDNYTGNFAPPYITVYKKEGGLWMTNKGEPDLKLLPESNTKFFSPNKEYDIQVEFETDNTGKVLKTTFIFSGLKKEAKRL